MGCLPIKAYREHRNSIQKNIKTCFKVNCTREWISSVSSAVIRKNEVTFKAIFIGGLSQK